MNIFSKKLNIKGTLLGIIRDVLKNKYTATSIIALFWVMFISDVDLFYIIDEQIDLNEMKAEVRSTSLKNVDLQLRLDEIKSNPEVLERVARERYFMKLPEEDVFRIVE
jgi:cell division protein DivIC